MIDLSSSFDVLEGLNPGQKKAVAHAHGTSIILAGAGSGKTRVLVHKVLNLILNYPVSAKQIVMITFTNKAANEMKERIQHYTGDAKATLGYVGTFHSFCAYILRRDGIHIGLDRIFAIYDPTDQETIIKNILKKIQPTRLTYSYFMNRISAAKNLLIPPEKYLEVFAFYGAAQVAEVYHQYQKVLKKNMAVDFDDLMMKTVQLFMEHPQILERYQDLFPYILVDEFQDTNYAQYVLTSLLGKKHKNVTVVGDFSQSIYSWRGADIKNLEKFSEDFPQTQIFNLDQNYRCTQTILDFAYSVISQNATHPVLQLFTKNGVGEEITFYQAANEQDESVFVATTIDKHVNNPLDYASYAVLYRTNAQSRVIEEAFLHYGIPYTLIGGVRFYERKEIKDLLSYLRLLVNPVDEAATQRIQKLGKRRWDKFKILYQDLKERVEEIETAELLEKIFQATQYLDLFDPDDPEDFSRIENIKELKSVAMRFTNIIQFLEQVALVESEYSEGEKRGKSKDGVRLMTLHQAKGLEFDHVFITGLEEGILPHVRALDDQLQMEEERRLFYVGITRAKQKLYITYARRRFIFGRRNEALKSRFISAQDSKENEYTSEKEYQEYDIDW